MAAKVTNDVQASFVQCPLHRHIVSRNCDLIYEISHVLRNLCVHAHGCYLIVVYFIFLYTVLHKFALYVCLLLLVTSMRTDFHHFRSSWWSRHNKSSTISRHSEPSAVSRTRHLSHRWAKRMMCLQWYFCFCGFFNWFIIHHLCHLSHRWAKRMMCLHW